MPYLPQGATLHSLATFWHRSSGARSVRASCLRYYGLPPSQLEVANPSGLGAQHLATEFLGGMPSGIELIRRHTLIGLYGSVMHDDWWGNRSVAKVAKGDSHSQWVGRHLMHGPLSWCPDCFREDLDRYGWAPWRVVHQPRFVHHCPDHGTALLSICTQCDEPLGCVRWRLPGDSCQKCKGNSFRPALIVEQSRGYQRMLRALLRMNGAMMSGEFIPTIKSGLYPALWGRGYEKLAQLSIEQLATDWALSDINVSIPKQLGFDKQPDPIQFSMWHPDYASPLAIVLLTSLLPQFE